MATTSSSVLWEVRGKSGLVASCHLHRLVAARFALIVTVGDQEIARRQFTVERDAIAEAVLLEADFMRSGWAQWYRSATG